MSLAHHRVYGIPILILIGWRGEPGTDDEPQHNIQGEACIEMINSTKLKYDILPTDFESSKLVIDKACETMLRTNSPFFLLVKKDTFEPYAPKNKEPQKQNFTLTRRDGLKIILSTVNEKHLVLGSTGFTSREIFEVRRELKQQNNDFLSVGSMGHNVIIALGVAMNTHKHIFCIEGDGSCIMHMGHMVTVGNSSPKNFLHLILNNESHESVGGQSTNLKNADLGQIAKGCGYKRVLTISDGDTLLKFIKEFSDNSNNELTFVEVKLKKGTKKDLIRPDKTPMETKFLFMDKINKL